VPVFDQSQLQGQDQHAQAEIEQRCILQNKVVFERSLVLVLNAESDGEPSLSLLEASGTSFRYQILPAALRGKFSALGELFKFVQDNQEAWGLADFQISQTTLEQIFNRFAATQTGQKNDQATPQTQAVAAVAAAAAQAPAASTVPVCTPAGGEVEAKTTVVCAAVVGKPLTPDEKWPAHNR